MSEVSNLSPRLLENSKEIDLVVTVGGDGTVL